MTTLDGAAGDTQPVPAWATFMDAGEYQAFADAVLADFRGRGIAARISEAGSVIEESDDSPNAYGLSNLAQLCHGLDRSAWAGAIRTHFANLAGGEETHDLLSEYGYARELLKVRVYRASELPPEALEGMVKRSVGADLVAVLAADLPTTVSTIGQRMADGWGVPVDELFAVASKHMAAEVPTYQHKLVEFGPGVVMHDLVGDSFFVASQVVRFGELGDAPQTGALVGVPNRHHLLWHAIETVDATVSMVQVMLRVADKLYQDGPGSITPQLYWWHRGALTLLPGRVDGRQIQFAPPDDFVEVLNSLT